MAVGDKYFLAEESSLILAKNKVNVISGYLGSSSISSIVDGTSVSNQINFGMQSTVKELLSTLNTIPKITDYSGQTVNPDSSSLDTSNRYNLILPTGYYNNESKIQIPNATLISDLGISADIIAENNSIAGVNGAYMGSTGNAKAAQVLSPYTFCNAEEKGITGTMPNYSSNNTTSTAKTGTFKSGTTGYIYTSPANAGYYGTGSYLKVPVANLSSENIVSGVSIGGVAGSAETLNIISSVYVHYTDYYTGGASTIVVCDGDGNKKSYKGTGDGSSGWVEFKNMKGMSISASWMKTGSSCDYDIRVRNATMLMVTYNSVYGGTVITATFQATSTSQVLVYYGSSIPSFPTSVIATVE